MARYSCAAHKLNIAVRKSVNAKQYVSAFLASLSNHARDIRHSIETQGLHRQNKCKIQRQNNTRWSSGLIMLVSYLKAYKKGLFNEDYACPQSEKEIAAYIEILLPIYTLSNELQHKSANISIVVPAILTVLFTLGKFAITDMNQNEFRKLLISHIKAKFSHELASNVYMAASVLNVESLRAWSGRSFGREYANQSMDSLVPVLTLFNPVRTNTDVEVTAEPVEETTENDRFFGCSFLTKLLRTTSVMLIHIVFFSLFLQRCELLLYFRNKTIKSDSRTQIKIWPISQLQSRNTKKKLRSSNLSLKTPEYCETLRFGKKTALDCQTYLG